MDTRAWGPSGWQMLHLIAHYEGDKAKYFFPNLKDILPCKFCRESTAKFLEEMPPKSPADRWLYDYDCPTISLYRKSQINKEWNT